jgi:threonine synthase
VPSGNFGNLASGLLANASGLPVAKFIAACNENDVVPRFFHSGKYEPRPSVPTISNAMDVGSPSNFVRILEMFNQNLAELKVRLDAASISDDQTAVTIVEVYDESGYILDPQGAVAYRALADYLDRHPDTNGIFLETAHPVKFDSVNEIIGTLGAVPPSVQRLFSKEKKSVEINNDYNWLKKLILNRFT